MRKVFVQLLLLGSISLWLFGCANVFRDNGRISYEPGFRQKLAPAKKALPLPVEIAQEIAEISENGTIYLAPVDSDIKGEQVLELRKPTPQQNPEKIEIKKPAQELVEKKVSEPVPVAEVIKKDDIQKVLSGEGPLSKKLSNKKKGPLAIGKVLDKFSKDKGGKTISYIVKLGDTLMKIAFEKYGNYLRWRDIYKVNRKKMSHYTKMHVGTELTIHNVKYVFVKKEGKPYLIKKGDTLKSIAKNVYGTSDKWKKIWKNNPQLIMNPKKIYAGFTLYYSGAELRKPAKSK